MFSISCPRHQSSVLVGNRRIRSLTNTESGIVLDIECYCGTHVIVHTGSRSTARPAAVAA